jgi:RNA polymerase sigma-70 factor (ECF subfamily)
MALSFPADAASFFDEMYPRVFRFVSVATGAGRSDIEDLVQETLLEAWRGRDRFRGDSAIETWVLAIAKNRVRLRHRERAVEGAPERALRAIAALETDLVPADVAQSEEMNRRVRRALEEIGEPYAEVLVRRYYEGLSIREIAGRTGESEKAIESRLHRAKDAFRERMKRGSDDDRRE